MATPHKDSTTKGGALQYQRLTPLGRAGLSALGLGLASPAPKAPAKPDSGPSYAAVTVQSESEKTKEKTNFQVDFDDAPCLPPGSRASASVPFPALEGYKQALVTEHGKAPAGDDETGPPGDSTLNGHTGTGDPSSLLKNDPSTSTMGVPVWCPPNTESRLKKLKSPMLRLHAEIVDFCRFLEPTSCEGTARAEAVDRIRAAVLVIWPNARFEVHGSFATGMYLVSVPIHHTPPA